MAGRVQIVGALSALALFLFCYYFFGDSLRGGGGDGGGASYYESSAVSTFRPARINIAKVRRWQTTNAAVAMAVAVAFFFFFFFY